ncbi:hypothetical protein AGABI2DRAFT_69625, partial [Agaricus bisporus var. bisporus H97]|uniref:hypothetical protein n=1 Tax=Agaricus bisporus var. bisporus (strain H97 / ATCC MYA-4626 / FGSC 10389) TaxID=936046 RepID=UPI00029F6842
MEEISSFICVLFIGSTVPTRQWLATKARPLLVRKNKIQDALFWLKEHNSLYANVVIDHDVLRRMGNEAFVPPIHIEHLQNSPASDLLTSRYDLDPAEHNNSGDVYPAVVVTDVDIVAPAHELRVAALRHIKGGGSYFQIPHNFDRVAKTFATVSVETLGKVTQKVISEGTFSLKTDEERKVMSLMRQVNSVTSGVYGSAAERMNMRNELRALVIEKGLPSFYLTINPADVYNPIVRLL